MTAQSPAGPSPADVLDRHPVTAVVALMKLSFDEQQRGALCRLGGLHGLAELLTAEHEAHGAHTDSSSCCSTRRSEPGRGRPRWGLEGVWVAMRGTLGRLEGRPVCQMEEILLMVLSQ